METQFVVSDQADAAPAPLVYRESALMRSVNTRMRQLADAFAYSDLVIFFCECRTASCFSPIPLSAEAFDAKVADQKGWLLCESHQPSELWRPRNPFPVEHTASSFRETASPPRKTRADDRRAAWSSAPLRNISLLLGRRNRGVDDLEAIASDGGSL